MILSFFFDGTCYDGTNPDEIPTNVWKMSIGIEGARFYYPGPGDEDENWITRTMGAAFGLGVWATRDKALDALKAAYIPGDHIVVIGFSRGATTARTFANSVCEDNSYPGVAFLGCFDTVAAFMPFGPAQQSIFHDLHVSPKVEAAYHAVALDEDRAAFAPNLMNHRPGVTECWFRGVHCDIGGGFEETGLSDMALAWMVDNAIQDGIPMDVKTSPNPDAPIGHVDWFGRHEPRDVVVLVDGEVSDIEPLRKDKS